MNLTLGFPEPVRQRILANRTGLAGALGRFEEWMANPDSPVRAIRHQPARAGEFVDIPDALAPALRESLTARGISRPDSHQAARGAPRRAPRPPRFVFATGRGLPPRGAEAATWSS